MSFEPSTVPLGNSGLRLTPVGLGCWQFSGGKGMLGRYWPALEQERVNAVVAAALEAGCNWFDTAEGYGNGHSEKALVRALRAAEKSGDSIDAPIVATKWWPFLRFAGNLRKGVKERREALGGRVIDLYQIHQRTSFSSLRAQMNALADLQQAGHARAVGVSNFSARAMRKSAALLQVRGVPLASNQVRYNLLDRRIETNGVLDEAQRLGITIIAYSPLAQGILTGRFHPGPELEAEVVSGPRRRTPNFHPRRLAAAGRIVAELRSVADGHDASPAQIALAWLTQRKPGAVVAIPGASTASQAGQNARSMMLQLTPDDIERLDAVSGRPTP